MPFIGEGVESGVRMAFGKKAYAAKDYVSEGFGLVSRFIDEKKWRKRKPAQRVRDYCALLRIAGDSGVLSAFTGMRPISSLTELLLLVAGVSNVPDSVAKGYVEKKK